MTGKSKVTAKIKILDNIFPPEYDFKGMLEEQAESTQKGGGTFVFWLRDVPLKDPRNIDKIAAEVDDLRHNLEQKMVEAFSTPFDRQDMYTLSRHMDYILNHTKETAREMYSFGVSPDEAIINMAEQIFRGTGLMVDAVRAMNNEESKVEEYIRMARKSMHEIDDTYIESMAKLLHTEDPMNALRKGEIYNHLREIERALRRAVDLLHKAFLGMN
ncbi:DUF47 domain-containing protein [Methanolacinia petrolearia]|uniref:DUF47 domain-containing protein n=1 Tax=Methanolacinia petrolearia TaxID=54120 RepID=UPI003BA913AD